MGAPRFFRDPDAFRKWLKMNHHKKEELWVGIFKKDTGKPSITWPEAIEQALCFGWIDGIRQKVDDLRYMVRFTPRRPQSNWSAINIKSVERLKKLGLMTPAGLEVFENRIKSKVYSYEERKKPVDPWFEKTLRKHDRAWKNYEAMTPSYRRTAAHWVMSAKKQETRERRMQHLIEKSEKKQPIKPLQRS